MCVLSQLILFFFSFVKEATCREDISRKSKQPLTLPATLAKITFKRLFVTLQTKPRQTHITPNSALWGEIRVRVKYIYYWILIIKWTFYNH